MSTCYIFNENGIKMSQQQLVESIKNKLVADPTFEGLAARLLSADVSKQTETINTIEQIRSAAKSKGRSYEGVSHFLEQKHVLGEGQSAVYLSPQFIEENYIQHYIKQNIDEGKAAHLTEAEIRAQIADSALESKMGTLQHSLLQALFENNGDIKSDAFKTAQQEILNHLDDTTSSEKQPLDYEKRSLREIVTQDNPSLTDAEIVNILSNNAKILYDKIVRRAEYKDAKFLSECELYGDDNIRTSDMKYQGLKGIADLIVVKKDGSIDIIDFKVCARPYDEWCTAKQYHTEYQLGVYRQLLAQHGIDGKNIGLFIQPIFMNKHNAQDTSIEGLQNVLRPSAGSSPYARLHWEFGHFTSNIRYLIPDRIKMSIETSIQVNDKALDKFHKMVDYNPAEKSYSKQELIDRKLHESVEHGQKIYFFYDRYERKRIVHKDKEFFIKDGGYIDKYILKMKNVRNEWVRDLYDAVQDYKKDANKFNFEDYDFLKTKGKGQVETIMNSIFGEFVKLYYKALDIPVLIENGILGFYNEHTGSCHFVVVTDQMLTSEYSKGKYGSVLGNFYTTDEVRSLPNITQVLPAECQYAELLKAMHIINMIADENTEYFRDKSIGSMRVINPEFGENQPVPINTLRQHYDILCQKTKTVNHFNKSITVSDPWVDFGFQLKLIEESGNEYNSKFIKSFTRSHKANANSVYNKLNELIKLRSAMESKYPRFQVKDFISAQRYDLSNPMDALFVQVSELIMYYQRIPIDAAGNFDKYGLNGRSLMELLQIPFTKNQALGNRGFGNGLFTSSAENSPSPTLRALSEYYTVAFTHIREKFLKEHNLLFKITQPYMTKHMNKASRMLSGTSTNMWEQLLIKDSNGQIAESLMLINPYQDNNLDNDTQKFLKAILWEINKYRYAEQFTEFADLNYLDNANEIDVLIRTNDTLINLTQSGRYFELPLKRARYFERWKKVGRIGLRNLLTKELETLKDDWDLTQTHGSHKSMIVKDLKKNATTMYNQYHMSPEDREYLIQREGHHDFELDLDLLALDVAYQGIREDYFENVLQTTAACATVLHVNQALTGINRHPELEALDIRQKTALKGQDDIPEEMQGAAKVVTAARKLNSVLALAFRPLQMIKELTFGQFTNYSRVLGTMGSSDKLTIKSVFNANKTIWGQSIGKWGKVFSDNADMASLTLCETLNKTYGIANEDISQIVNTTMTNRHGVLANVSKYMYIFSSAPDYFNRLTLFVAKMMEDGCFEAHSLDADGNLVYDFKKDTRFSELVKHGLNSNYRGEKYLEQKGLYLAMLEQFQLEGRNYIEYDENSKVIYKEFDRAYTTKQRNSIKEVADTAYGYYDHETKSLVDLGLFGLLYKQFQIFLTAKVNLWFKGRPSTKGDNTSQGRFKIVTTESGEKCYRRLISDADGNVVDVKIVPESELTPEEKGQLDYAYAWEGDYVEGLVYSIFMTIHDLFHLDFESIKNNKYRMGNVALALHDLLIGMLLFSIFKWLFSGGTKRMQDIQPLQRTLVRAMGDVSPKAIASMTWEPGFSSNIVNLRDDAIKIFTDDDPDILKMLSGRIGAMRDLTYNED